MINVEAANDEQSGSDSEVDAIEDGDTCSSQEIFAQFREVFRVQDESAVSLRRDYILSLSSDSNLIRVAAGLSNGSVQLFDTEAGLHLKSFMYIPPPSVKANICRVRFLDETPNLLLVGTTNGLIRLFDLRTNQEQARFDQKDSKGFKDFPLMLETITCFDINANSRVLCAGTEKFLQNVFLQFYDVRQRKLLGVYSQSHGDDVTDVLFHDKNPDLLCTGATDGLINVFDIKETKEVEALLNTINTESSVHRLNWHKNTYEKYIISCITHTNDFKAYKCFEGDEIVSFGRADITAGIRRKSLSNFNLINAHNIQGGEIFLLAGTNSGEIMRSVGIVNKNTLQPLANFIDNKQIVRESLYAAEKNLLITGGESGIVTMWTMQTDGVSSKADHVSQLKMKTTHIAKKSTPY